MKENRLTQDVLDGLEQGSKVQFKWHGSKELYTGRIEVDKFGVKYFVSEHNYQGHILKNEGMRYYNSLESFFCFTHFEVLREEK